MKSTTVSKIKNGLSKGTSVLMNYRHAIPLIVYGIVYWFWFSYLEKTVTSHYRIIHMSVDDYIPFCEVFVIPYFLWFVYVSAVVLYMLFRNKDDYYKTCVFLFTGMTIFLIISTLWPNGHHLRPSVMPRDNIFTHMIAALWRTDTPTNLWPSIHVYNSLGAHFAVIHNEELSRRRWIKNGSAVLACSIILSTVLIKQHSMFDVLTAFVMAAVMYTVVYRFDLVLAVHNAHQRRKANPQIVR